MTDLTESLTDVSSLIKEYGENSFQPFASYDKHLDCIRVYTRDCSVFEERLSRIFTVFKAAHSEINDVYVGFAIKGVRHLFEQIELPADHVYKMTDIINGIVRIYPDMFVKLVREEFHQVINDMNVEVEFDQDIAA